MQDLDELLEGDGHSILIDRSQHGGMHAHIGDHDLRVNTGDLETGRPSATLDGRILDDSPTANGNGDVQGLGH